MIQREGPLQNFSEYTPGFAIAGALMFIAALPDRRWGDEAISVGTQCLVGLFDSGHATWRKTRLRAIAPRIEYPFAPLVCAAAPLPCSRRGDARRISGSATKFLPAAGWP